MRQLWYPMSKTLAEKSAWDFAKEKGLDVVVVNPGTVMGPVISPKLNASMILLVRLLQGKYPLENLPIFCNYFLTLSAHIGLISYLYLAKFNWGVFKPIMCQI